MSVTNWWRNIYKTYNIYYCFSTIKKRNNISSDWKFVQVFSDTVVKSMPCFGGKDWGWFYCFRYLFSFCFIDNCSIFLNGIYILSASIYLLCRRVLMAGIGYIYIINWWTMHQWQLYYSGHILKWHEYIFLQSLVLYKT